MKLNTEVRRHREFYLINTLSLCNSVFISLISTCVFLLFTQSKSSFSCGFGFTFLTKIWLFSLNSCFMLQGGNIFFQFFSKLRNNVLYLSLTYAENQKDALSGFNKTKQILLCLERKKMKIILQRL